MLMLSKALWLSIQNFHLQLSYGREAKMTFLKSSGKCTYQIQENKGLLTFFFKIA